MSFRKAVSLALTWVLAASFAEAQTLPSPQFLTPPSGDNSTHAATTAFVAGSFPLQTAHRQPGITDDVTTGIYPTMTWLSAGTTWVNISNATGQAIWQKVEQLPLPGDVIGLHVSAAAVSSGGTSYVSGDVGKTLTLAGGVVLTISSVATGAVSGVTVTNPSMHGVCAPVTTSAPVVANSGTAGSGATFNLTVLYPTVYAVRRVSSCFIGSLLEVQNSATLQTKNIAYLSDNSLDIATAIGFGTGGKQMEQYANYNDGPTPNVAIWYDQGGNPTPNNATQAIVAQQPVLFAGRRMGNSVPVLFNSQGFSGSGLPYPQQVSLTIPNSLTLAGANSTLLAGGGAVNYASSFVALTPVGGGTTDQLGMNDNSGYPACVSQNAGGTGSVNGVIAAVVPETPDIYGCGWTGGVLVTSDTYRPAPTSTAQIGGYVAGSTHAISVAPAANCNVAAAHTISIVSGTSETYQQAIAALIAAVNADPVFQTAGITASLSLMYDYAMAFYLPVGSGCSPTVQGTGDSFFFVTNASGGGWNYAGGQLGTWASAFNGFMYEGIVAIVPWAMSAADQTRFRQSVHYHFQINGHPGAIIQVIGASNTMGYLTPFLQDSVNEIPRLLGRDDLVITNKNAAGQSIVNNILPSWNNGIISGPARFLTSGKPTNNIMMINGEVNSLTNPGSAPAEYNAIQTLAGKAHAVGWKTICAGSYLASFSATQQSEMVAMQGMLNATPGNCDMVFNPQTVGVFNIPTPGPWTLPIFEQVDGGSHPSPVGNALQGALAAQVLRSMLQ